MNNHIHLIAVPEKEDGLQRVLKPLHMRYAQRLNRAHGWKGHIWQGRFFSSPLDDTYLWAAIRYVERNPVRAKRVLSAGDYPWSSAAAHCGLTQDRVLTAHTNWIQSQQASNGSSWLEESDNSEALNVLRRNVEKGLPCGADNFIRTLEKISGRVLQYRPIGRSAKEKG